MQRSLRKVCQYFIATILVQVSLSGCGNRSETKKDGPASFKGVTVQVSLQKDSPIVAGIKTAISEWEIATGGSVSLAEVEKIDPNADVCIADGRFVDSLKDPTPIPDSILNDRKFDSLELSPTFRQRYCSRNNQAIALPIGTEIVLLWLRDDLFDNSAIAAEYQKLNGTKLAVPTTWDEYLKIAKFFHNSKWVKYGCVTATEPNRDLLRAFYAHTAAFAKGSNWYSFEFDTETGESRLSQPPFLKGLSNFVESMKYSPNAGGKKMDDLAARRIFRNGECAMLLSSLPPTVDSQKTEPGKFDEKITVADLPGSMEVFDPRKGSYVKLPRLNLPTHLGSSGWFVMLGKGSNRDAATNLASFIAGKDQAVLLIQGVRKGYVPFRPTILNQYERFTSYGLRLATTTRFLGFVVSAIQKENWVNDLRVADAPEFEKKLLEHLRAALEGKESPTDALNRCHQEWTAMLTPIKAEFLARYRDSIGLPPK